MLLETKDLRVCYGRAEALRGVSISIDEGSVVCVIGANGAGKTTILKTISGLAKPSSGEIWFGGKRIDRLPAHQIVASGIAHIPEGRMVFAPMTVVDNLRMGAFTRNDNLQINKDLESIYQHFPILKEKRSQLAGSLSGGQQQMLAIGRALMANPKLLLMDEPSMGLSPLLVEEVGKIIMDLNKGGMSIILVEQNASMALSLASKAYVLEIGSISIEGPAQELANDERVKKAYLGG